MADLSQMLSQILSTDEGKKQVNQVLSMLVKNDNQDGASVPSQSGGNNMPDLSGLFASLQGGAQAQQDSNQGGNNMPDLSGLFASLQGGAQAQQQQDSNQGGNNMPDLSGLFASLQGGAQPQQSGNQASAPQNSGTMPDLSGLLSMLQGGGNSGGGLPNLDFGKLMKVQQLLSQRRDDSSTALLRALKPHLAEENRKKVDDAVRIMELLDLLPLIKESGLLGSLLGGEHD